MLYLILLINFFITFVSSAPSSYFFISARRRELYLFLTICSVLIFPMAFEIKAHFLPYYKTMVIRNRSSEGAHLDLTFKGSKWFIHLSLHCLGVLKYFLFDSINNFLATSLHLHGWIDSSKVLKPVII